MPSSTPATKRYVTSGPPWPQRETIYGKLFVYIEISTRKGEVEVNLPVWPPTWFGHPVTAGDPRLSRVQSYHTIIVLCYDFSETCNNETGVSAQLYFVCSLNHFVLSSLVCHLWQPILTSMELLATFLAVTLHHRYIQMWYGNEVSNGCLMQDFCFR